MSFDAHTREHLRGLPDQSLSSAEVGLILDAVEEAERDRDTALTILGEQSLRLGQLERVLRDVQAIPARIEMLLAPTPTLQERSET